MVNRPSGDRKEDIDLDTFAYQEINAFDKAEALETLRRIISQHQLDPNFPQDVLDRASDLLKKEKHSDVSDVDIRQVFNEIATERDLQLNDSPYPEVRAVVSNTDDPSTPCNTFRVWFIGTVFSVLGCAINQLFYYRMPGISISHYVAQFAAYPCGKFLAKWLPKRRFNIFGWKFSLNPGPFNQKEHTLISVMTAVSFGGAYVTDIFVVQRLKIFYDQNEVGSKAGYQILLALSTQLLGYGCAGITRRFLVYPAQMIWPSNLAVIALNRAMHHDEGKTAETVQGPFGKLWTMTRTRFLFLTFALMFAYFWLPAYLFQALSTFNWITWIAPSSVMVAIFTGSLSGLGLNPVPTFDWNAVTALIDPIVTPFFATANIAFGMFVVGVTFIPAVYFTNTWNTGYLPINSNMAYDNTGNMYNVSRVLDAHGDLDVAAYEAYSSAYFSASNALSYGAFFVIYTATISYVALYHWKEIWHVAKGFRSWKILRESRKDVHNRLMMAYKEVPDWWYISIGVIAIIFGIMCVEGYSTDMPVWAIFFSVALCLTLQIPIGIIMAVTNIEITNNVLAEFIGGYCLPGKPIPVMIFKSYGYIATSQSISFSSDMKLGFYMKIPPRLLFATQTFATVVGALTSVAVTDWVIVNVPDLCTEAQASHFSCPYTNTFFSSSVIWGVLGPERIYGEGGIYHVLTWGFVIGALLPLPVYLYTLRYPRSWLRHVYVPVILAGALNWAPYNLAYIWPALVSGYFFNYYLKRQHSAWWNKYAFILTTSWNIAIACGGIAIFFALGYYNRSLDWWGNALPGGGCDGAGCSLLQIPDSGSF